MRRNPAVFVSAILFPQKKPRKHRDSQVKISMLVELIIQLSFLRISSIVAFLAFARIFNALSIESDVLCFRDLTRHGPSWMSVIVGCPPIYIHFGVSFMLDSQGAHRKQMPILGRLSHVQFMSKSPEYDLS